MQQTSSKLKQNLSDSNTSSPYCDSLVNQVVQKNINKLQELIRNRIETIQKESQPLQNSTIQANQQQPKLSQNNSSLAVQQLSNFQLKLSECKINMLRQIQIQIDNQRDKYLVILNDYEEKNTELIQLQSINYRLSNEILRLKQQNMSTGSKKSEQSATAMRKNNEKLIQQNKEQMQKLFRSLSENEQLKGELEEINGRYQKQMKQSRVKQEIYLNRIKEQEVLIAKYKNINYEALSEEKLNQVYEGNQNGKIMSSVIKMQIVKLKQQIQQFKQRQIQQIKELSGLKQLIEQREDDNRYLRNQMLNKDQEIFKLKMQKIQWDAMKLVGSKDSLKYSQDESKIAPNLEQIQNNRFSKNSKESDIWNSNQIIIEDDFEFQSESSRMRNRNENNNQEKQEQQYKQTGDFAENQQKKPLTRLHDFSKQGISQILSSQLQIPNTLKISFNQLQNLKILELQNQNKKLKEDLNNLYNTVEDSKRQEELAIIKNERDQLVNEVKQLKDESMEYVIKIKQMQDQVNKSEEKASFLIKRQEWNNELIEKLKQQNVSMSYNKDRQINEHSTFALFQQDDQKNKRINKLRAQKDRLSKQLSQTRLQLNEIQFQLEQTQQNCRGLKKQNKQRLRQIRSIQLKMLQVQGREEQYRQRIQQLEHQKTRQINKLVKLVNKYKETIKINQQKIQSLNMSHEDTIHKMQCEMLSNKITNNPYYHKYKESEGENKKLNDQILNLKEKMTSLQTRQVSASKVSRSVNTQVFNINVNQVETENEQQRKVDNNPTKYQSEVIQYQLPSNIPNDKYEQLKLQILQSQQKHKTLIQSLNIKIEQLKTQKYILKQQVQLLSRRQTFSNKNINNQQQLNDIKIVRVKSQNGKYDKINKEIDGISAEIEIERMKRQVDSEKQGVKQQPPKASKTKFTPEQKLLHAQVKFLNSLIIQKDKQILLLRNTEITKIKKLPSYQFKKQSNYESNQKWKKFYAIHPES